MNSSHTAIMEFIPNPGGKRPDYIQTRLKVQVDMNPAQVDMNPAQVDMNPAQDDMNPAQVEMIPAQVEIIPAQVEMIPEQDDMNPAQVDMNPAPDDKQSRITSSKRVTTVDLSPIPQADNTGCKRPKRKREGSAVLTSSPYIAVLKQKSEAKKKGSVNEKLQQVHNSRKKLQLESPKLSKKIVDAKQKNKINKKLSKSQEKELP